MILPIIKDLRIKNNKIYNLETISINDLFEKYKVPKSINYLSIDTEGSEFEILNSLDFNSYHISIITVEHNFQIEKRLILYLLVKDLNKFQVNFLNLMIGI